MPTPPPLAPITTQEAADLLGISPRRVRALITAGKLPATKHGRDYLINVHDLASVRYRQPGRPRKQPAPELPQAAAQLIATLTPERQPVATVYRRLNWGRQMLERTISQHRAELERAGLRMHVATHSEASGRLDRYITVDGTRYSTLSRG